MEELNPLYSTWVTEAQYDNALETLFFNTGGNSYLVSDISLSDWDFIQRVNDFARQIRQLSHDFTPSVIKNIEKGLLAAKLNNENLEDFLSDISDENTKESLRKLKDTPILEELAEKASQREGKIVLKGGLVGTALWCVEALYRIHKGPVDQNIVDLVEKHYPGKFSKEQCGQMSKKYLRTDNPDDRHDFHTILELLSE